MKKQLKPFTITSFVVCLWTGLAGYGQNIGVGTTTPQTPLDIRSTAGQVVRVEGINPYISFFNGPVYSGYLWYNSDKMELGTPIGSGESVLIAPGRINTAYFTTAGNVGIGIASPADKLHVNGNINLTGLLKVNGSSGSTGQVLTSNGASDLQWKDAAYDNDTRFCFTMNENGSGGTVNFFETRYNLNTADIVRNPASITINKTGLYHFDLYLNIIITYGTGASYNPDMFLEFSVNGNIYEVLQGKAIPLVPGSPGPSYGLTHHFSVQLYITAPTTITLPYNIYTAGTPSARQIFGHFSGNLISE
jgi:hypothetical protein